MPLTVIAVLAGRSRYAAAAPQRVPKLRAWAHEVSAGMDSGVRVSLLLWANVTGTGIALFLGLAFAAQLEAVRVSVSGPGEPDRWEPAPGSNRKRFPGRRPRHELRELEVSVHRG